MRVRVRLGSDLRKLMPNPNPNPNPNLRKLMPEWLESDISHVREVE